MPRRPESAREQFEAWAVKPEQSLHIDRHPDYPDTYHFWTTEQAWVAYKAARAEALEEVATFVRVEANHTSRMGGIWTADSLADAIQALKEKPA